MQDNKKKIIPLVSFKLINTFNDGDYNVEQNEKMKRNNAEIIN